jgi:hypothetical protein
MASFPFLAILLLGFASNPLIWFFAIMYLANDHWRFSLRSVLILTTFAAVAMGLITYAIRDAARP